MGKGVSEVLSFAEIKIDGNNPWDIKVNDERFYERVLADGALGAGGALEKWWDCDRLDEFCSRVLKANLQEKIRSNLKLISAVLFIKMFNKQSKSEAFRPTVKSTIVHRQRSFYKYA